MLVTLREDEFCPLRGVLTRFYLKLAKMQKWQIGECSKNKGFSGVDFPIK